MNDNDNEVTLTMISILVVKLGGRVTVSRHDLTNLKRDYISLNQVVNDEDEIILTLTKREA